MASLPQFYTTVPLILHQSFSLEQETAKHIVQVLRMTIGEAIYLTDGKGTKALATIMGTSKKQCEVQIRELTKTETHHPKLYLGVAFTKNASRNEWLLEKAVELGVHTILPILTTRSERIHFKEDRWNNILIAAMLQSQQTHLAVLTSPINFSKLLLEYEQLPQKLMAHCMDDAHKQPLKEAMKADTDTIVLIGPEGDFTKEEITMAAAQQFKNIDLGSNRLRTETAALAACAYFKLINS